MAGGFHVTSPESPTYQPALTKSPSLSNLEFFLLFLELFFWLIKLFPTCVLQLSLGHKPHFILSVRAEIVSLSFCFKLCLPFEAKLTVEMHKVVFPKVFMFKISYFPTCCKELYLAAKSFRWAHTRSSRLHIQQGSILACSRSMSEKKGKEGTRGKYNELNCTKSKSK